MIEISNLNKQGFQSIAFKIKILGALSVGDGRKLFKALGMFKYRLKINNL
jgi:hypothetical protein